MNRAWIVGMMLVVGCGERLEGSTWKGKFEKDTVTFEFTTKEVVKCTWSRDWSGTPVSTTSDLTYSVDGKTVYFKGAKVTGKAQLENGDMIGTPVDFGFENLDSTARVVVKRQQ